MFKHWFIMSKPLNYAVSTKSRKTMRHQLSKPNTFQPLFTQQPTMVYNLIGPARSWHYPLQCYTILGLFNAFSTLLKLIFHQVTYITTIFQWHVGYPWSPHGLTSLPCFLNLMVTTFQNCKCILLNFIWTCYSTKNQVSMLSFSLDIRLLLG